MGFVTPYFLAKYIIAFLEDVQLFASDAGWAIAFKKKRDRNNHLIDQRYRCALEKFDRCSNVIMIDPNIAADRVVFASDAVLGVPFTSPCLMAKHFGTPSAFYDPTEQLLMTLEQDYRDVKLLSGQEALQKWFLQLNAQFE